MSTLPPLIAKLNNLYLEFIGPIIILGTLGVLLAVIIHYLLIGPHGKELSKLEPEIIRLNFLERLTHFVRMVSTVILAVTGISFALFRPGSLGFDYPVIYNTHLIFAILFTVSSLISIVIWLKDNFFTKYDWQWLKVLGGYLTRKEIHPPAGKFNAGQKIFYWLSSILSIIIIISGVMLAYYDKFILGSLIWAAVLHGICAILLTATIIGHAYLGSVANPGTLGSIFHGKVAREWAKKHHPQWYEKLMQKDKQKNEKKLRLITEN